MSDKLTVSDLQTIAKVLGDLVEHHRDILRRLDNSRVLRGDALKAGSLMHLESMKRYEGILGRVHNEILELEWEV
jgi:hypothetical protein